MPKPVRQEPGQAGKKWYRTLDEAVEVACEHKNDGEHKIKEIWVYIEHHSPPHVIGYRCEI